ncbi:MAG: ATP-binding protein [Thermodesulfovibrionales bacterium]|nr:ATP-binding protein [Thermodesulfovibrionales bacterium]
MSYGHPPDSLPAKTGIFSRMLITYAVVFLSCVLFVELYITSAVRKNYVETLTERLITEARLIAPSVSFGAEGGLDGLAKELKGKTGARITIIAADGKVLGDSDTDSSLMDNHAGRPEIRQAVYSGTGRAIRQSGTIRHDFLYTALRVTKGAETAGALRLAVPLVEVDRAVGRLRLEIILVVGLVLVAAGAFSTAQIMRLRGLTRQIAGFTSSLASGDLGKRLLFEGAGEFDEIAGNLNAMASELKSLISKNDEEKNRLSAILKSIPDALLIIEPKGTISLASSASREFFGFKEPITGKPFIEVVRSPGFFSMMEEAGRSLSPQERELKIARPGEKYLTVRVSPIFYKESVLTGYVALFHDITGLKRLEEVRKDFVANVSHEIKTPITAIKGFADTLLEGAVEDRENAVRFLKAIKSNSERLNSLVDDLMTISGLELGAIRVERSVTGIEDVFEAVSSMLSENALKKGLCMKTYINPEIKEITADKDRLIQILTNLADNAIKFTETGGVTFGADKEEGRPFIFVEDTGIGIPKKHLPRIGERFYRVDPSRSRKLGGTGLGLAIVKHLVLAHGWHMGIESREGKGTKVKIFVS